MKVDKRIVIINGSGGVGKDEFCNLCSEFVEVNMVSTIDLIAEAYRVLGWNGVKTEEDRKNLSDMKDMSTRRFDLPYRYVKQEINYFMLNDYQELMFIHSREPDEIARFAEDFKATTLLLRNPKVNKIESNHADREVENYNYDYTISNNGTKKALKKKAKIFIKEIFNNDEISGSK